MKFSYDPALTKLARDLRRKSGLSEVLLWRHLKGSQRIGFAFQRQKPVDRYILDFFSTELMLAIEIDDGSHKFKEVEDGIRQRRLEQLGVRFLRFPENEVRKNIDGVLQAIDLWIEANRAR
jgi:very-short-patch-repair endonuclease